jgi:glycosyltransferase involved in cell wall biosynthesis
MRIGVDYCGFDPRFPAGMHNFALGLTKGLLKSVDPSDTIVVVLSQQNEAALRAEFAGLPVSFVQVAVGRSTRYVNLAIWSFSWVIRRFNLRCWWDQYLRQRSMSTIDQSVDVLIVPTAKLNFFGLNTPSILCVHDIQHEYHPELFSFSKRVIRWGAYRASCWKAAAVQASSMYIRNCLVEKFDFIDPRKIFLAHEGVDLNDFLSALPVERPRAIADLPVNSFVFYPAQLWPHKNHLLLIDALAIFRDRTGVELACVLTGHDYGHWQRVQERARERSLKRVHYLGRVSFSEMLWLYRSCRGVLALGIHESSSLPVREGAVFGKPLICANIPPNVETQEFLHLRLFDRDNALDLADAFSELLDDGSTLSRESSENANLVKDLDWTSIARIYLTAARSLVTGSACLQ